MKKRMKTKKEILLRGMSIFREDPRRFFEYLSRYFLPRRKEYREPFRMRLDEWLLYNQEHEGCTWMGVKALKNPPDLWIYQEILYDVKPDIIVELGSAEGGTTLYLANLLDLIGKGKVISVDNDRRKYNVEHDRIEMVTGDTASSKTVAKVSSLCPQNNLVLVIHDACHKKENVLEDMRLYSPLVSIGSYFIVEDGIQDLFKPGNCIGTFERGPLFAIDEFLKENPKFIVDKTREHYILTHNPNGFLLRVRK